MGPSLQYNPDGNQIPELYPTSISVAPASGGNDAQPDRNTEYWETRDIIESLNG